VPRNLYEDPGSFAASEEGRTLAQSKVLANAAPSLGLRVNGLWMLGRYRDHPVAVRDLGQMQGGQLVFQVLLTQEAVPGASAAVSDKERVKALDLKPGFLRVDPNAREVIYTHTPAFRAPKPEDVTRMLDGVVAIAAEGGPALGTMCEECHAAPGEVRVINDMPTQLCEADFARIGAASGMQMAAAGVAKPDYGRAIAGGLLGMFLGAALWAGIGIATERIFSLVAIAVAAIVGILLAKGAGRVTWPLIGVMAVFAILAVVLGDIIWIAALIASLGGGFDLGLAIQVYPLAIGEDSSFALSYFFALIGVFIIGRWMMGAKKAQTPRFEVVS
jgi:hypothetical protein